MGVFNIFSKTKQYAVSQKELIDSVKTSQTLIIDVRSFVEYRQSHLTPCHNIDFKDKSFESKISKYDKSKSYLLVCQSSSRSKKALKVMIKLGFKKIGFLEGGMDQWSLSKRLK